MNTRRSAVPIDLLLFALSVLGTDCPVSAQMTMQDVIDNVRQNEALYSDIDLTIRCEYTTANDAPATFADEGMKVILSRNSLTHCVAQGGLLRVDLREDKTRTDARVRTNRRWAFDGTTTRIHDEGRYGNVVGEHRRDYEFIFPHMLLLQNQHINVPLSTYLTSDKAIKADPSAKWSDAISLERAYAGEVEEDGEVYHKIICIGRLSNGAEHYRNELFLSEKRNFLPVRRVCYSPKCSSSIPDFEGSVTDLREVGPGIWFPYSAECVKYDQFIIQAKARQQLRWKRQYDVEAVSLDPAYPGSYFADVDFPDGTPVYEIEGRKVVRSYRKGAPSDIAPISRTAGLRAWHIALINASVVAIAIIWAAIARRRAKEGVRRISV